MDDFLNGVIGFDIIRGPIGKDVPSGKSHFVVDIIHLVESVGEIGHRNIGYITQLFFCQSRHTSTPPLVL